MRVIIPGEPVAQGRPRLTTIGGRARAYDPKKSRQWKKEAAVCMGYPRDPAFPDGPLRLKIRAFHPLPKSSHRKRDPVKRQYRTKRPDIENIAKAVMDAATGVLYTDDSQVVQLKVEQFTCGQDEEPRVEIEVSVAPGAGQINGIECTF